MVLTLGAHAQQGLWYLVCVCVCVCVSQFVCPAYVYRGITRQTRNTNNMGGKNKKALCFALFAHRGHTVYSQAIFDLLNLGGRKGYYLERFNLCDLLLATCLL